MKNVSTKQFGTSNSLHPSPPWDIRIEILALKTIGSNDHTWESIATLLKFAVHAEKKKTECLCAAAVMLCTKGFFV